MQCSEKLWPAIACCISNITLRECESPVLPATNTVEPAARAGHCAVLRASTVVPTAARSCLLAMLVVAGACMCRLFSMHTLLQSTSKAAASLPLDRLHQFAALQLGIAVASWIPASAEHVD